MSTIAETLKIARGYIDTPEKWAKCHRRSRRIGHNVFPVLDNEPADCFCLVGAIDEAAGVGAYEAEDVYAEVAKTIRDTGHRASYLQDDGALVWVFNDARERTYDEVMTVLNRTIERVEHQ